MNKKFTKLIAALALLVFMTPSMVGWGQTTETITYTFTDKDWKATDNDNAAANWTNYTSGDSFESASPARGIAKSKATINGTSPVVVNDITSVTVVASANQAGPTLTIYKVVDNTETSIYSVSMTKDNNKEYTINLTGVNVFSGKIKVVLASSSSYKSVWIKSVSVSHTIGGGSTDPSITISGDEIQNDEVNLDWNDQDVYTADVVYNNMDTPSSDDVAVGVYSDESCETAFTGNWFIADFATNSVESIEYAFLGNNASSDTRTVYMRVETYNAEETDWVPCNVIAITQAAQPQVATPTFSPAAGAVALGTEVSISCATENATIYYTVNNGDITEYAEPIVITEATTIQAFATADGYSDSETVTANYTIAEIHTVAWALENTPSTGVYVQGIVSSFYNESIMGDGQNFRYYISDNGGTYNGELLVYKGKDLGNVAFNSVDDLMIGDVVTIYGDLYNYQGTKEFNAGNYIVDKTRPVHNPYDLTLPEWENFELYTFIGLESEWAFDYDDDEADHWGTVQVNDGTQVELSISVNQDYAIQTLVVDGVDVTNQLDESDLYVFMMPAHDVTVTVTATRLPYYTISLTTNGIADGTVEVTQGQAIGTLPTATAEYIPAGYTFIGWLATDYEVSNTAPEGLITANYVPSGDVTLKAVFAEETSVSYQKVSGNVSLINNGTYLIAVNKVNSSKYNFANGQASSGHASVEATGVATADTYSLSDIPEGAVEFLLSGDNTNGFSIHCSNGYLNATSAKQSLSYGTSLSETWKFTVKDNGFVLTGATYGSKTSSNSSTAASSIRNYASSGSHYDPLYFFKKEGVYSNYRTSLTESYTLTITGYNNDGGWNLIASPVTMTPSTNDIITEDDNEQHTYDLYYFDQTAESEWKNYRQHSFNLVPEKGYLYANKNGGIYTLAGTPYSGTGVVTLEYSDGNPSVNMRGLNLIGNPYNANTTIDSDREFYIMNSAGSQIIVADNDHKTIAPMQGIFVKAAGANETVTFTPATQGSSLNNSSLVLNLIQNRGDVIDRAIVRFGNGGTLPKIQLFENSTKLYILQYNEDYAVVKAEAQGEMPVNFKAKENGTYTLSIDAENVEMNYLHLIDNMTGMDINLLQTPSYTFEATTRDYESRFRLVFAGASTGSATDDNFAFFSNGNLIINNDGNATLQVIDITGRILSSESVNGSVSTTLNATPGVYMLRLINGENVKVQKIVVR